MKSGFSANLAVYQVGKEIVWQYNADGTRVEAGKAIAWRLQLGSAFIPAIPLLIGIFLCPGNYRPIQGCNSIDAHVLQNRPVGISRKISTMMPISLFAVFEIQSSRPLAIYITYMLKYY